MFVLIFRAVGLPPCSTVSHLKISLWVCCGGFEEKDQDRHKNLWIWMQGFKKIIKVRVVNKQGFFKSP